jgi:hypothetical protein
MIPLNVCCIIRDCICNPEVNQLQLTFDKHEICWLEIRMDDLLVMDDLHRLQNLSILRSA